MILIQYAIIFFIISEVLFFFSFFWSYFWERFIFNLKRGIYWPNKGIYPFYPYGVPFLNSILLLRSGGSVTWSHIIIYEKNHNSIINSINLTLIFGLSFTILQTYEYFQRTFTIEDSTYGRIFFLITGFHGIHVIIGSLILISVKIRINKGIININHHVNIELSIWYWHFVDIVWLFLYIWVYWWIWDNSINI